MATGPARRGIPKALIWGAWLLHCALLFYLSSRPAPEYPRIGIPQQDKIAHLGAYAVWGALLAWALVRTWPALATRWWITITLLAGVLFGLSDEFHQSFVPTREADGLDVLADTLGTFAGALVALAFRYRRRSSGPLPPAREP